MASEGEMPSEPRTDLSRWRLKTHEGAHHWKYLSQEISIRQPQSFAERYFLRLPKVRLELYSYFI